MYPCNADTAALGRHAASLDATAFKMLLTECDLKLGEYRQNAPLDESDDEAGDPEQRLEDNILQYSREMIRAWATAADFPTAFDVDSR